MPQSGEASSHLQKSLFGHPIHSETLHQSNLKHWKVTWRFLRPPRFWYVWSLTCNWVLPRRVARVGDGAVAQPNSESSIDNFQDNQAFDV